MEFVCNDINGPSKWYWNADDERYYRTMANGEVRYSLHKDNIADPSKIEEQGKVPQSSTVKLWEHKLANAN